MGCCQMYCKEAHIFELSNDSSFINYFEKKEVEVIDTNQIETEVKDSTPYIYNIALSLIILKKIRRE